jgi:hypothetical protein
VTVHLPQGDLHDDGPVSVVASPGADELIVDVGEAPTAYRTPAWISTGIAVLVANDQLAGLYIDLRVTPGQRGV